MDFRPVREASMAKIKSAFTIKEIAGDTEPTIVVAYSLYRLIEMGFVEICGMFDDEMLYQMTDFGRSCLAVLEELNEHTSDE
jgi:hypothetical protein